MMEEPFWLGIMAVFVVLFFITIVYLLKKKFADRIEHFFAQEIERSKTQSAFGVDNRTGNRYSLTSNLALNLNNTGNNIMIPQCRMRHSHSSIICKLNNCKHHRRLTGGYSDTECNNTACKTYLNKDYLTVSKGQNGYFSDTEYMTNQKRFPALLFFSQKIVNTTSNAPNDNLSRKSSSSQNRSVEKPRRYSLYDFVINRQSRQNNLFGFDLADKLTRRKKSSKKHTKNMQLTAHKSKSSTESDHLRIPENVGII